MANNTTKTSGTGKHRRIKPKVIRRTAGGVLMATAIAVAAIPTGSYGGGQAGATVITADDGSKTFTHTVQAPYYMGYDTADGLDDNTSLHNEVYGLKSYTGLSMDFATTATALTFYSDGLNIPECDAGDTAGVPNTTIYSTGDGDFQFAYVDSTGKQTGGGTKTAIILGYNHQGSLAGGTLTIPDNVDAYLNFNDNDGSSSGFCAVGKSGNFLFYESEVTTSVNSSAYYYVIPDGTAKTDADGKPLYRIYLWDSVAADYSSVYSVELNADDLAVYRANTANGVENTDYRVDPVYLDVYYNYLPCYYATYSTWVNATLYYYETENYRPNGTPKSSAHKDTTPQQNLIPQIADVNDASYGRISGATVTAIGKQYLVSDNSNGWKIGGLINETNGVSKGIFAGNSYITTLNIGNNLSGIGDYAFYGCTNMTSISTGNGLNTLGNHAFDNCRNMNTVAIPIACNLSTIGAYCFKNCQALQRFALPTSVTTIGDGAFKGCWNLVTIDLGTSGNGNGSLTNIGVYAFIDCQKLDSLTFPQGFSQTMELSAFEGCQSLRFIASLNTSFNIVDSTTCDYSWDEFKVDQADGSIIKDKFYVESPSSGVLHTTCRENEVSYKYPNQDVYELTKKEKGLATAAVQPTVTYQVDSNNVLTDTRFSGAATSLTFPDYIGPFHIEKIGDYAFQDQCSLVEVTIAATIEEIGSGAFMGCHNIKYVYFNTDDVVIGNNAFQTQSVSVHAATCTNYSGNDSDFDGDPTNDKAINLYSAATMTKDDNTPKVELAFIGKIGAGVTPYEYAMSYDGRYNNGSQATSFITYYSGWPTMLTVKFNMTDSSTHEGYSELVDFPTALTLSSYQNEEYLTKEYQKAAEKALQDMQQNKPLTEDAQTFVNSASKLVVPSGIDAIEDGLFYSLTNGLSTTMDVELYGIKKIETGYNSSGDPDATKSDFYGCPQLGAVTIAGDDKYPLVKSVDDYGFADCSNMKSFTVKNTLTELGDNAVSNDPKLETVSIQADVNNVGENCFANDTTLKTVQIYGAINDIGDKCFDGDVKLTSFYDSNSIGRLGNYAFNDCETLESVIFAGEINTMGVRPWAGCEILTDVQFPNSNNFTCDLSIVYGKNANVKTSVVELLEGRSSKVEAAELNTVTKLEDECFMGTNVKSISLYDSKVTQIPTRCFADTKKIREIVLPSAQTAAYVIIDDYAFEGSTVDEISGEGNVSLISAVGTDGIITPDGSTTVAHDADNNPVTSNTSTDNNKYVTIYCPDGTVLYRYANMYKFNVETVRETKYWTVTFRDWNEAEQKNETVATLSVADGEPVDPYYIPTPNGKSGYVFGNWDSSTESTLNEIWEDTIFTASYVTPDDSYGKNKVCFYYYNESADPTHTTPILIDTQYVVSGADASAPTAPTVSGYTFDYWSPAYTNVTKDIDVYAVYKEGYTVVFTYVDPTTGKTVDYQTVAVASGKDATQLVKEPTITGYTFSGWSGWSSGGYTDLTNVTCDMYGTGYFTKNAASNSGVEGYYTVKYYVDGNLYLSALVASGSDASTASGPAKPGYKFTGWSPAPTNVTEDMSVTALYEVDPNSSGNTPGGNGSGNGNGYYTLTVVNGSGSGTYQAGAQAIIVANDPASGLQFGNWTISPDNAVIASKGLSATVITMPSENVTVTANYVTKTSGNGTGAGTGGNGGNSNTPSSTPTSSGTTVVIDKNGLSNTGVVSATVNGSSDNFVIKVSETSAASEAVLKALLNQYGNVDKIVYFPMDISLYDSTGSKKITDTTGLSITITLPLPDSMIQYAGNNKTAAVVNNQLESLAPKFTTINGVACVTFTCTHFSPYVIYADTANLTGGTAAGGSGVTGTGNGTIDSTPKTGDGIKPKYFLAVALAAGSVFLFLKKDKKKVRKAN